MLLIILVCIALLLLGRVVHEKAANVRAEIAEEARSLHQIRVRIMTIAKTKPKRKDVTQRYAVESEIERRGLGTVIDASMGAHYVELVVAALDAEQAVAGIGEILSAAGLDERTEVSTIQRQP